MFKNKLVYLFLVFITGILSILYNKYFMSIVFLAIILLPFFLVIIAGITIYYIQTDIKPVNNTARKEESFSFAVLIKNPTIFPITRLTLEVTYQNNITDIEKKEAVTLAMDLRSTRRIDFNLSSKHCGNIKLKVKKVRIYDYFLIFRFGKKQSISASIPIIPPAHEIFEDFIEDNYHLEMDCDSDNFSKHKPGNDPSEVYGIREYREGDRASRIHWKLSNKQDKLMIKEFSDPIKDRVVIYLDFYSVQTGEEKLYYYDGLMETAMSVSNTCLNYGHPHKIYWCRDEGSCNQFSISEQEKRYNALTTLLKEKPGEKHFFDTPYWLEERNKVTHIIYITSHLEEENMNQFLQGLEGVICYLFYLIDEENAAQKEVITSLFNSGVTVYKIKLNDLKGSISQIGMH